MGNPRGPDFPARQRRGTMSIAFEDSAAALPEQSADAPSDPEADSPKKKKKSKSQANKAQVNKAQAKGKCCFKA